MNKYRFSDILTTPKIPRLIVHVAKLIYINTQGHVIFFIYIIRNVQANIRRLSVTRVSCTAFQQLSLQRHSK